MLQDENQAQDAIDVFLEKSSTYKSIHCDGFYVTPNGHGLAVLSFYNERLAIPKHIQLVRGEDGDYTENFVDGKKGVFRQIDASIFLDLQTVADLIEDLTSMKSFLEKLGSPQGDVSDD